MEGQDSGDLPHPLHLVCQAPEESDAENGRPNPLRHGVQWSCVRLRSPPARAAKWRQACYMATRAALAAGNVPNGLFRMEALSLLASRCARLPGRRSASTKDRPTRRARTAIRCEAPKTVPLQPQGSQFSSMRASRMTFSQTARSLSTICRNSSGPARVRSTPCSSNRCFKPGFCAAARMAV